MIITHKLTIDLSRRGVTVNLDMVQGDSNTRNIEITLTAAGVSWEPPAGTTAAVAFLKPDGTKGLYDNLPNGVSAISMSGNTITATMAPQVLTCVGAVMASIVFYDTDMGTLATFPFRITVARNPAAGEQISNDYYDFATLEEVNKAVKNAIASLEKAKADFMAETGKAQADFLEKAEEALSVVHGAATEDAPAIVCESIGQIVQVVDASNRVLHGLTLYGKTTQNGIPTPEAPVPLESVGESVNVTVKNKNLIPYPYYQQEVSGDTHVSNGGVTFTTNEDGSITMTGTNTASASADREYLFTKNNKVWLPVGEYTFSTGAELVTDSSWYLMASMYSGIIAGGSVYARGGSIKFTVTEPGYLYAVLRVNANRTVNVTVYPQLEVGSVATEYEKHITAQTLTASTPNGLPGIPVTSGGNYTDDSGQQWVCDEIDFARGVYVKRVITKTINALSTVPISSYTNPNGKIYYFGIEDDNTLTDCALITTRKVRTDVSPTGINLGEVRFIKNSKGIYIAYVALPVETVEEATAMLNTESMTVMYATNAPTETALSAEELAAYSALHTNKPNTTVYNDAGAGMKVEYVADTKLYIDQKLAAISAALLNA